MENISYFSEEELFKCFTISLVEPNSILLSFNETIYANSFFQYGSEIQNLFENRLYSEHSTHELIDVSNYKTIIVSLSNTKWFDTLALAYLFLFIYDSIDKYASDLDIKFILSHDAVFNSFLLDNGFYHHIKNICHDVPDDIIADNIIYSSVHKCFYPFDVFDSKDDIIEKVSNIKMRMENAFSNYIEPEMLDHLINKVSYFLYETMENVFEHAYTQNGRCGILIKNVNCSEGIDYKHYLQSYTSKTPYNNITMFEDSYAFLEVYVLDTGCGLIKSFAPDSNLTDSNIIDFIFEDGKRSFKKMKDAPTKYGGLFDIKELFEQDADGLGLKSDSVWKYVYKGHKKDNPERINPRTPYGSYDNLIHGFALVAYVHLPKNIVVNPDEDNYINSIPDSIINDLFLNHTNDNTFNNIHVIDERWDNTFYLNSDKVLANETVVFPPSVSTKSWISNQIINNHSDYLLFLEVPDVELKKYKSNITGIDNRKITAQKIIVITKSLYVFFFSIDSSGCYRESPNERDIYIKQTWSSGQNLIDSFSATIKFEISFNSFIFWNEAINRTDNFSYIPERIYWSEKKDLYGYLDFSQIYRIPVCRDICIQMLNELRVLKHCAYFNSVDPFTDEICDRANYAVGGKKEGKRINIGSVFVSGTSNRLLSNTDDCFYFLCHPDAEKTDIFSLLEWVKKDIEQENNISEYRFKRLGSSSFIAPGGSDYWLSKHYHNNTNAFKLNTSTMYKLLQRRIGVHPDTVKIGHFESTERHDIFGYRINHWFDSDVVDRQLKSDYEKESIFDYLITNFFFSLFGRIKHDKKESFFKLLNDSLSSGIREALYSKYKLADNKPITEQQGIIVHLFDFQTTIIVEKISRYLNQDTINRIIPLIPLSRVYEMGALVISPLILDRIEMQINRIHENRKEAIITIFVSVVFNVRILEEIKQILYSIGADKVKVLTVLDRRRIPVIETQPSIISLGRVDSPALNGKNHCAACEAIFKLKKCKNIINNIDIINRLDDIISRWQCIKLSDKDYQKGIESTKITLSLEAQSIVNKFCEEYFGDSLNLELDSSLCSLVVEYTIISSSSQLIIFLLRTENIISENQTGISSDELKLLLASVYLLLFASNPISYKEINDIALKLIELLDQQKAISKYTGLAALTICSLPDNFINNICYQYELIEDLPDKNPWQSHNIDSLITRTIVLLKTQTAQDYKECPLLERRIRCLLRGGQNKLECLYDIFMYSEKSYKNSHRHAFSKIIDSAAANMKDYQAAYDYTNKIVDIINCDRVFESLFHGKNILNNNKNIVLTEAGNAISSLKLIVDTNDEIDKQLSILETSAKFNVDKFIQCMVNLNTINLYLRTPAQDDVKDKNNILNWLSYCKKVAMERVPNCNKENIGVDITVPTTEFGEQNVRPWFYSFCDVTEEVINHIVDILQYHDGQINVSKKPYTGFIKLHFTSRYVEIRFYNSTKIINSIEEITDIKHSKSNRDSMLVFKEFERRLGKEGNKQINCFDYNYIKWPSKNEDNIDDVFLAVMRIPYINRGSSGNLDVYDREGSL